MSDVDGGVRHRNEAGEALTRDETVALQKACFPLELLPLPTIEVVRSLHQGYIEICSEASDHAQGAGASTGGV